MIGGHLDKTTFETLMEEALALVDARVDKRQGSIIYDTLATSSVQLAQGYIQLKGYYLDTYALTAQGSYLDHRVSEAGVHRYPATPAIKVGTFTDADGGPAQVPAGVRFASINDKAPLLYAVVEPHMDNDAPILGSYRMRCETVGAVGNDYAGELIKVSNVKGVATAMMGELVIPGRDEEPDDDLRARYIERINRPGFGGNVAHYREWIKAIEGVGAVQVYPAWRGGGTVKCLITGADHMPANAVLVDVVQTTIDPEVNQGLGLGLAPIGAQVTIDTPTTTSIRIEATLTLAHGVTVPQVQAECEEAVESYFAQQRKLFGVSPISVYRAQMIAELLGVQGVQNVTGLMINGADVDIDLPSGEGDASIPLRGDVTLRGI